MNRVLTRVYLGQASLLALSLMWTTPSSAQTAKTGDESGARAKDNGYAEIIVTARRRAERLQDVPVAATALGREDLERYQTNGFQRLSSQMPELQIGDTGDSGGPVINLRGVGSPSAGPSIDQAVAINVDGIQFSQSQALRMGLYDINRIEVLKGPQALFYGKNSPAGVISIISENPGNKFEAKLRAGYEFANERKYVEGLISAPLGGGFGARLDGYYANQNGWFRNDAKPIPAVPVPAILGGAGQLTDAGVGSKQRTGSDQKEYFVRGTLSYESPGSFVDGTLKVSYGSLHRNNGNGGVTNQFANCALGVPLYVALLGSQGSTDCKLDRYYNEPDIPAAVQALDPVFQRNNGRHYIISKQLLNALTLNFHLSDKVTLTSVTGYYDLKEAFAGNFSNVDLSFVESTARIRIKQFSQEARLLTSFDSPFNFMAGAYYQDIKNTQRNLSVFGSPLIEAFTGGFLTGYQIPDNNFEVLNTKAYSFFGQVIVDVAPKVQVTAGGRYSKERKSVRGDALTPQTFLGADALNIPFSPDHRSFSNFSPEVTATYKPMPNLTLYAAYRTGFKSGGFDLNQGTIFFGSTSIGDISFNQEKVRGFEVGAKGSLADRQIIFDFAAYQYKYKGLQVSAFDSRSLGYRVTNAASATVRGVELAAQFRPHAIQGLSIRSAINYNDSHYSSFPNAPCYSGQSIAAGCSFVSTRSATGGLVITPVGPGGTGNVQDLSGRHLTRAPVWTGNIGGTYEQPVGGLTVIGSIDGVYSGGYFADPAQDARSRQKSAWRLNASITLRGPDDHWELAAIGTNLTQVIRGVNNYGLVGTGSGTGTNGAILSDMISSPSEVRTVSLQFTYKY